jgi:predicted porin
MKKLLIASAALAMVAGTAQAQSSVSVYGSIDASYGDSETKVSNQGAASRSITSSGFGGASTGGSLTSSRLGFRGTEDLGGGLAANFNLEYQLQNGTGTTTTTDIRTSTVGLSSKKFGTFNVGRQLTGIHGVLTATSPIAANNMAGDIIYSADQTVSDENSSSFTSLTQVVGLRMHEGVGMSAVRMNNSVSYVSPAFSGFTARVDYASDAADSNSTRLNNNTKQDHLGLSANYTQGNLLVTAGTHTVKAKAASASAVTGSQVLADGVTPQTLAVDEKPQTGATVLRAPASAVTTANDDHKFTTNALAARYTMGSLKFNVIYAEKEQAREGQKAYKSDAMQFGVSYDMGKNTLAAQYGEGTTKFVNPTSDLNGMKVDSKAFQLAAIHNLSKRTNVYAAYGQEDRKIGTSPQDTTMIGNKTKRTQYAVGLRHSF